VKVCIKLISMTVVNRHIALDWDAEILCRKHITITTCLLSVTFSVWLSSVGICYINLYNSGNNRSTLNTKTGFKKRWKLVLQSVIWLRHKIPASQFFRRLLIELSLCYSNVYHYTGAQWYKQLSEVGGLDRALILLGLALSPEHLSIFGLYGAILIKFGYILLCCIF